MSNIKYSVNEITDGIVVLESVVDSKVKYVSISDIPFSVMENDIILIDGDKYKKDLIEKQNRIDRIQQKLNRLQKKD